MKQGWEIKKLGEVVEIRNGKNQQAVLSETGKFKIMGSAGNIMGYATEYICEAGTTIIGRKGNISKPIYINEKFWNVDTAFGFYPKNENEIDKRLIYYLCLGIDFGSMNRGTTIPSLVKSELQTIQISYPKSLPEQQRIVAILDEAFDAMAKAKSNAEQNLKNAKELFERYLQGVFENKGEGWEEKTLKEVCVKITDGTHQTPKYFDDGVIFLSSKNVTSGKIDWDNIKYIDEKQHLEMHKRVAPKVGDILLAKNGTTGVAAMVDRDLVFDIYVSLAHIRVLNVVTPEFMLYFINSPVAKKQFNKRLKGMGVPNLHLEEIREVVISFPKTIKEQKQVVQKLDDFSVETKKLEAIYQQKINNLEELKKSVLQKAFSGELKSNAVAV